MDRSKASKGEVAREGDAHDLPVDVVTKIEALCAKLDDVDHYQLLGIPRASTKAQVRAAFLRSAPAFHPDRYFGKRLGAIGPKMQRVFSRLTLAHDTLLADDRRAAYDASLPPPAPEALPPPAPAPPPPPAPAPPPPASTTSVASSTAPIRRASISVSLDAAERARREAFAARLSASKSSTQIRAAAPVSRTATPIQPMVSAASPEQTKAAADALRRRYEEKMMSTKGRQVSTHTHAAQVAESKGNLDEAASQYREAMSHSSDPSIRAAYDDVSTRARQQAAEAYLGAARDHEAQKSWPEAAAAYAKVFAFAPSADVAHRAANAYRRGGGDPRRAAHFGEEAVKLEPHKAIYRLTLALIYVEAGLMLRARGELDRAQALEPTHPMIRDVMGKLKLR
jgi:tetratricopeptide (TPR) repeat protein